MADYGLTPAGWVSKPFDVIKTELENDAKALWSDAIDLSANSKMGNHVNNQALKFTQVWESIEAVVSSFNPDNAEGVPLAGIAGLVGVTPLGATKTVIPGVLYGASGTPIPLNHKASFTNGTLFLLSSAITISESNFADIIVSLVADPIAAEVFTVTIDAIPYTYTAGGGETKTDVVTALRTAINAGALAVTATLIGDTLRVVSDNGLTAFSASLTATLQFDKIGSPGSYIADDLYIGKVAAPINALTVVTQNVPGLDSIDNLTAGTSGRNVETDAELRVRRRNALATIGWSTEDAIQARLLQEVENVTYCRVYSNRLDTTDGDGRPGHSLEVVIEGGLDADVAKKIWELSPAGIDFFGSTSTLITDSNGDIQTIKYNRATPKYVWANIVITKATEEAFPTNGTDLVKSAIVNWGLENHTVGTDVLIDKFDIPIYSIPGVYSRTIEIGLSDSAGTPPVAFFGVNQAISVRELAQFDVARLNVSAV